MIIELESVRTLREPERSWVPPLAERMYQPVDATVRLLVLLDGEVHVHPWVKIIEVTDSGYVGLFWEDYASPEGKGKVIQRDTKIAFTADNIIEI